MPVLAASHERCRRPPLLMKATITEVIRGASPAALFEQVAVLDRFPPWMRLVHEVEPIVVGDEVADGGNPSWWVQLRAKVGPFTRSKRLRMERTEFEPGRRARFERVEHDDRDHANWILVADVAPEPVVTADGVAGAEITMELEYTGELWTAGVLGRILDDEIRRATGALTELLAPSTP